MSVLRAPRATAAGIIGAIAFVAIAGGVTALAQGSTAMDPAAIADLMDEGSRVYANNCAACHGADGNGVNAPVLAGDTRLASVRVIVNQVAFGGADMPAFEGLSNGQIAAVATYVRRSWGNAFDPVSEEAVAAYR